MAKPSLSRLAALRIGAITDTQLVVLMAVLPALLRAVKAAKAYEVRADPDTWTELCDALAEIEE